MEAPVTVSTFYAFTPIQEPRGLRAPILAQMQVLGIRGTITLAREGINATISGAAAAMDALMEFLKTHITFTTPTYRETYTAAQPFKRSKVKVKPELISLGVRADPAVCVGTFVMPRDWNALITQPDVILIDTRNDYEYQLGHFAGALNPGTRHFKQMVGWTAEQLKPKANQRIAMYCTGGIRCEKYSSYLLSLGFSEIYHLHGGILAYLEQVPAHESLWHGACFVFDERVSVGG